ncbi:MAG: bifunctional histidinol-phosphatase/imidazoleglycerol-phosphate dehydratase HisB [Cyclobacteriaceae bacterium]|nr:bifunctional histidinol-phosphatase/imidazoleglycerol-phosphate dehydratase HisB [Cyclobacteriaceae bacterium]MCH8515393.1 bifunctional histidinol-phosphatase/imidazoleglycerol-phosphate dehydratase HisB [Cyclobacteriaceae bacterium]
MRKILFIDRDGTIIEEPKTDFQVDSFKKLAFLPYAISELRKLVENTDFELVMVTNQDGLGTDSFPESDFWPVHNKMMDILAAEGITFSEVLIDRSFESEGKPTRKPGTGMMTAYMDGSVDMNRSYVIGDRATDVTLAKNLGCRSIRIAEENDANADFTSTDWRSIYQYLALPSRIAKIERETNETAISIELNLDGSGKTTVKTGLPFFDHMLDQLGKHSDCDLYVKVEGDLQVDEHHTIEDTAIALGEAFLKAIGDKKGIRRYGFLLPMDDALAQVAIDFGGRPWIVWDATFKREMIGDMPTEMFFHFFKSFSDAAKCNLNIKVEGDNEHHKIEGIFKALAKAIKVAVERDESKLTKLPSTKGML